MDPRDDDDSELEPIAPGPLPCISVASRPSGRLELDFRGEFRFTRDTPQPDEDEPRPDHVISAE